MEVSQEMRQLLKEARGAIEERCGSCGQVLRVNRDGYAIAHANRGDGHCVYR